MISEMLYLANCHKTFMVQEGQDECILLNQSKINLCSLTSLTQLITHDVTLFQLALLLRKVSL